MRRAPSCGRSRQELQPTHVLMDDERDGGVRPQVLQGVPALLQVKHLGLSPSIGQVKIEILLFNNFFCVFF